MANNLNNSVKEKIEPPRKNLKRKTTEKEYRKIYERAKKLNAVEGVDRNALLLDALKHPVNFGVALGFKLQEVQIRMLDACLKYPRVAIKGCHASTKTFTMSLLAVWWALRYEKSLVLTTAPTFEQVKNVMWGEIGAKYKLIQERLPFFKIPPPDKVQWKLDHQCTILGRSTNKSVNLQGFHSDNILLIADEAPGIVSDLWGAIEGIAASGNIRIIMLGNPTIPSGMFFDAFENPVWHPIELSALRDNPNVLSLPLSGWQPRFGEQPDKCSEEEIMRLATLLSYEEDDPELENNEIIHMPTRQWIRNMWYTWGQERLPDWYSRVLGQFPPEAADALLSRSSVKAAGKDTIETLKTAKEIVWGVDVAGPGKNETVAIARAGDDVLGMWVWKSEDCRGELLEVLRPLANQTAKVHIDNAGLGDFFTKYIADVANDEFPDVDVIGINAGRRANNRNRYKNLRTEMMWQLKERFDTNRIAGIHDELLRRQLLSLIWRVDPMGLRQMEPKPEMEKRGVPSPDRADALMLAFAEVNLSDSAVPKLVEWDPEPMYEISRY